MGTARRRSQLHKAKEKAKKKQKKKKTKKKIARKAKRAKRKAKPQVSPRTLAGEKLNNVSAPKLVKSVVDMITARKDHQQFANYLACSGCIWAARELRHSLSSKVKRKYKGDVVRARIKKEVDVRRGVDAACDRSRYPEEMAAVNPDFANLTVFEYRPKDEAKALGNWPASSRVTDECVAVCNALLPRLAPNVVERALWAKRPVWKLEWERWACLETLGVCDDYWFKDKEKPKTRDEDDWWGEDEESTEL